MKRLALALILFTSPVFSYEMQYRQTTCNVYYNNMGRVFEGVPCKAWFTYDKSLSRVKVYLPHVKDWFDWGTGYSNVTKDPRWKECIRHTGKAGNQYQVCTQKSPDQLKIN